MSSLGKKIVVVGVSASGKSTFARTLEKQTGLPLIHMDSIWWKPSWVEAGEEEATKQLESITTNPEWIIEGYIPKTARPFVFERADKIVYLDYPPIVASVRYLRRWLKHRKNPRPELAGSPEKFDLKFLKLVWKKGEAISLNKFLKLVEDQSKILKLTSPKQTETLLKTI